jgi:hypothetical protein
MMKSLRSPALILLIAVMAPVGAVAAQESAPPSGRGPVLLTLPASTRALGLGNAFAIGGTDSDAIFYNTAFADRMRGAGLAVQWYGSSSTLYTMSAAVEWWRGALAVGVRALDHGLPSDPATGQRNESVRADEGTLTEPGVAASERAASVAYSRTVRGLRIGLTGHLVEQRLEQETQAFPAADISLGMPFGFIATGLAVRNLGPSYELAGSNVDLPLMITANAAATAARPVGPFDMLPALYLTWEVDGDVVPGAGIEISYWPVPGRTFTLRAGVRNAADRVRPFTVGAGFTGDRILLDYALVPYEGGTLSHRVGLRWR